MYQHLLSPIHAFLGCPTPQAWLDRAAHPDSLPLLLIDHANCELKAAQTAMWLMRTYALDTPSSEAVLAWLKPYEDYVYRRVGNGDFSHHAQLSKKLMGRTEFALGDQLIDRMVLLIKEELHHFQQVLEIMRARGIAYDNLGAARYARGLMQQVRTYEPARLVDKLICGALIEARSCERFAALAPLVDSSLGDFYVSLLRSEARHFQDYLKLAQDASTQPIDDRVAALSAVEAELISTPDPVFRFHSGIPAWP